MNIIEISQYKGNTVCVIFDNNKRMYINQAIASKHSLIVGMSMTNADAIAIIKENETRKAKERALYLLESRDHSRQELFMKLVRTYDEDISREICDYLEDVHLLDDERYANRLFCHLLEVKKYGRYRIKQELRQKGIDRDTIETLIDSIDEDEYMDRLKELVNCKYERYLVDEKGYIKVKNALIRLGYSYSEVMKC